ncbi:hypothetical protein ACFL6S_23070 [Candidatus Poribacteria bacterium]
MKLRWGRIFFVVILFLVIVAFLWLHDNADAVRETWRSFSTELSDLSASDTLRICLYLALGFGVIVFVLWVFSRVIGWYRR